MRLRNGLLKLSISGLLMAGLLMVGGTGFAQETAKVMPDAEIEANVLKALAGVPQLADQSISTTTVYGQVTLSGTVRDEASRDMAEKVAADAPGVKKVIDELAIDAAATAESAPAQDQGNADAENGPVLQSDGTYAPAQDAQGQSTPDEGDANAEAAPPPPPQQQGPNQPDGQYRRPYGPPYNQQSAGNARTYTDQLGGESVVVPKGALIRVRVNEAMNSRNTAPGTIFDGVVLNDVIAGNAVAIPRGSAVQGRVVDTQSAGALKGKGELALQLTQITLGGQTYPVVSDAWTHRGADKTGQTVGNAVGLGAFGAMIGAIAGGGPGALLGAGLGGAAGVGVSAASGRGDSMIPAEAILTFHLAQQVPMVTVSQTEMNRLASGVGPIARPTMQRRPYPRPYPYYYYGPAYYPY